MKNIIFIIIYSIINVSTIVFADITVNPSDQNISNNFEAFYSLTVETRIETEIPANHIGTYFKSPDEDKIIMEMSGEASMVDPDGFLVVSSHVLGPEYLARNYCKQEKFSFLFLKKIIVSYKLTNGKNIFFGKYVIAAKNKNCICEEINIIMSSSYKGHNISTFLVEDIENDIAIIRVPTKNHPHVKLTLNLMIEPDQELCAFNYSAGKISTYAGFIKNIAPKKTYQNANPNINNNGFIELSAMSIPGYSGGSITNSEFELIGIISGISLDVIKIRDDGLMDVKILSTFASKSENVIKLLEEAKTVYREKFSQ